MATQRGSISSMATGNDESRARRFGGGGEEPAAPPPDPRLFSRYFDAVDGTACVPAGITPAELAALRGDRPAGKRGAGPPQRDRHAERLRLPHKRGQLGGVGGNDDGVGGECLVAQAVGVVAGRKHAFRVIAVNTLGLKSAPSEPAK